MGCNTSVGGCTVQRNASPPRTSILFSIYRIGMILETVTLKAASTIEHIAHRSAMTPQDAAGKLLICNIREYFAPV